MLKELSTRLDDKAARDTAMVHLLYDMALRAFEKDLRVLVDYDDARKDIAGEVSRLVAKST